MNSVPFTKEEAEQRERIRRLNATVGGRNLLLKEDLLAQAERLTTIAASLEKIGVPTSLISDLRKAAELMTKAANALHVAKDDGPKNRLAMSQAEGI